MLKALFIGRRAPGCTRGAALAHLRDVHGRMVVCAPADAGPMPRDYVQNHVIDGAYPGTGEYALERDLVTELWFDDLHQLSASTQTPYYLDKLKPDEPRFVDEATVAKMLVRPSTLLEGAESEFKAFLSISRGDVDDDAWSAGRQIAAAAFCRAEGMVAAVENEVMSPPDRSRPFVDVVLEGWFSAKDEAFSVLEHMEDMIRAFGPSSVDIKRSFGVIAEQFNTSRLKNLHGC